MSGRRKLTGATFSPSALLPLVSAVREAGLDPEEVLAFGGLTGADLHDPARRIPREVVGDVWRRAAELSGDPAFGLRVAQHVRPGALDAIQYIVRNRRTLGEAIASLTRYATLVAEGLSVKAVIAPERVRLSYRVAGKDFPAVATDFILASLAQFVHGLVDPPVRLTEVRLARPAPADPTPYREAFAAPVRFGARDNALSFPRACLESRIRRADPSLSSLLEARAEELLQCADRSADVPSRVRRIIAENLPDGGPGAAAVARRLHMSSRTLHRRLREAQTTHSELLDEVRSLLADRYLAQGELSRKEIATVLGFHDTSALRKALARWRKQGTDPPRAR